MTVCPQNIGFSWTNVMSTGGFHGQTTYRTSKSHSRVLHYKNIIIFATYHMTAE